MKKSTRFKNLGALVRSMRPYAGEMLLTIAGSFLKQLSALGAAALTSYMAGLAMQGQLAERFSGLFAPLVLCILLRAAFYFGEMWLGHDVAFRVIRDFRLALYEKIDALAPAYLQRERTGRLGQTLVGDVEVLELFLAHTFGSLVVAVVVTAAVTAALFAVSPLLAVLMPVFATALAAVPYAMRKKAGAQGADVRDRLAGVSALTLEGIQGLRELLTLNSVERYKEKNAAHMDGLYKAQLRYGRRQGMESLMTQTAVGVFTVAVMGAAAGLVAAGRVDFALYPVAVVLAAMVLAPAVELSAMAQNLGLVFAAAGRIQELLSETPEVADTGIDDSASEDCTITFEDVSFSYGSNGRDALRGVSFSVREGETVALVGPSGAGKTTCISLLLRYRDAQSGSVKIGGRDIRDMTLHRLRETVTAVPQETYMFYTTIRENIRLGRPGATDGEVEDAARAAWAHGFILSLPEGYDTVTGERGFQLSGGQRQRIAIARTLLRDRPIIVFDEAVSNLDTENERAILQSLESQLAGKTVLIIAHRLSTILAADRIVVLEEGRVVQAGTREQLMDSGGYYKILEDCQLDV